MTRLLLAFLAASALTGCGSDSDAQKGAAPTEAQACAAVEQVTDAYQDGLRDAATPQDARSVIDGAVSGLRDVDAPTPLSGRIDALADALSSLREAVEAGRPPAQLQPQAAAVGTSATALAKECGRDTGAAP